MIKRRNIKWIVPFFLVGLFAINLPTILNGQPQATFNKPVANQKFSYYFSKAKKNNKKGSKAYAANNAIQALAVAEKKSQIKKSQKLLAETMPLAIQWIERLAATNEKQDKTFNGDRTISNQLHLISGLKEMTYTKAQYSQLPSDRLKMKKGPALNFTIEDYQARIKKEESLLPELFEKGAAMHYTAAMKLEGNRHWSNQINIAKKLAKVVYYVPDYKDAKERYAKAKKEGVCRMTLGRVQNISQRGHLTEEAIRNDMIYDLTKRGADVNTHNYFKLIRAHQTNQIAANVELSVEVTNIYLKNGQEEPYKDNHKKTEEKDGKEIEYRAVSISYSKWVDVYIEGTYFIHDLVTGQLLNTDHFVVKEGWRHEWATYTGDKRALSKSVSYKVKKKNEYNPTLQQMIDSTGGGAFGLSNKLGQVVRDFAKAYK